MVPEGKWLETIDVPLMKCDFLAVTAQFVADDAESFEFIVAALVKAGVLVQFTE